MRRRDALRRVRRFLEAKYPDLADCYVEACKDGEDGRRRWYWSFGVHFDDEDPRLQDFGERGLVGYVHPNGHVEGLY